MSLSIVDAMDILSDEYGCSDYTDTGAITALGTVSTSGNSNVLNGVNTGNITTYLAIDDLVVIDYEHYTVTAVTTSTITIDKTINIPNPKTWSYVKEDEAEDYKKEMNKRNRALSTANRLVVLYGCDENPMPENHKTAVALLACRLYNGTFSTIQKMNVTSERIGDMSYTYSNQQMPPLPKDIIFLLGDCYNGGIQPDFFTR